MKRCKDLVEGRRRKILDLLQENVRVSVEELSEILEVSPVTIRRDLQVLEDQNWIERFHGGAIVLEETNTEQVRLERQRQRIARYAAALIRDNNSVFINSSMTALGVLDYIDRKNVTVITNNGKVITKNYPGSVNVIMTGGEIRQPKYAMVGDYAVQSIRNVFSDKAFLGCSGFHSHVGMTTKIAAEVRINRLMVNNTRQNVYVLADHTKIGKVSTFTSVAPDLIGNLITDNETPESLLAEIRNAGVTVHIAS